MKSYCSELCAQNEWTYILGCVQLVYLEETRWTSAFRPFIMFCSSELICNYSLEDDQDYTTILHCMVYSSYPSLKTTGGELATLPLVASLVLPVAAGRFPSQNKVACGHQPRSPQTKSWHWEQCEPNGRPMTVQLDSCSCWSGAYRSECEEKVDSA